MSDSSSGVKIDNCYSPSYFKSINSKRKLISRIYTSQKTNSNNRGHELPEYSLERLISFSLKDEIFHTLYKEWSESNYDRDLKPSIDRIDPNLRYYFDNIKWVTWKFNRDKSHFDVINNIQARNNKSIVMESVKTGEMFYFSSIKEASLSTGANRAAISMCCNRLRKTAGGYLCNFQQKYI